MYIDFFDLMIYILTEVFDFMKSCIMSLLHIPTNIINNIIKS